jgi:hypothetical protein
MPQRTPITDADAAAEYFSQPDGGYCLDGRERRREWIGDAAGPIDVGHAIAEHEETRLPGGQRRDQKGGTG